MQSVLGQQETIANNDKDKYSIHNTVKVAWGNARKIKIDMANLLDSQQCMYTSDGSERLGLTLNCQLSLCDV